MIGLAEARLGMESSRDWQAIDLTTGSVMRWFLDATNDPEKRNPIFGQKSFDKLAELGQMRDWMDWLKEQFDRAETEGREHLQRELARAAPDRATRGEDKWQVAIRLYSPAQSIRSGAIKSWNQRPTWIKLAAVYNDKQAVDVEFTFGETMHHAGSRRGGLPRRAAFRCRHEHRLGGLLVVGKAEPDWAVLPAPHRSQGARKHKARSHHACWPEIRVETRGSQGEPPDAHSHVPWHGVPLG